MILLQKLCWIGVLRSTDVGSGELGVKLMAGEGVVQSFIWWVGRPFVHTHLTVSHGSQQLTEPNAQLDSVEGVIG